MVVFLAVALLLPPLPFVLAVWAARRWRLPWIAAAAVGVLVGLVVMRATALGYLAPAAAVGLAAGTAVLAAWLYARLAAARQFCTFLAPVLLVVPAAFLWNPGVARVLRERAQPPVQSFRSGARTPVVVLVLDELPLASLLDARGELDAVKAPSLAAFAREAVWYRGALAPADETYRALPALLTGIVAPDVTPRMRQRNLFTLLGDYPVLALEPVGGLCPPGRNQLRQERRPEIGERARRLLADLPVVWAQLVAPPRWRADLPALAGWQQFAAATRPAPSGRRHGGIGLLGRRREIPRLLASVAPGDHPLYFAHVLLPHLPWEYLPSGRLYRCEPDCYVSDVMPTERWRAAHLYQRYLLQLRYVDALVGELLGRLRTAGLYDRALVAIVADHGEAFRPGLPIRSSAPSTLSSVLAVPLLLKLPGSHAARVVDEPVSTADLLATIADVLQVQPPWPLPGRSLLASGTRPSPTFVTDERTVATASPAVGAGVPSVRDELRALLGLEPGSDLLAVGPRPELLGTSVSAHPAASGAPAAVTVVLAQPDRWDDVDPGASSLPLLVTGVLRGASRGDGCCTLAVAVDGTVGATTHSYWTADGEHRFSALLPERALRRGRVRVDVYLVDEGASGAALRRATPPR